MSGDATGDGFSSVAPGPWVNAATTIICPTNCWRERSMTDPVLTFGSTIHVGGFRWSGNLTTVDKASR